MTGRDSLPTHPRAFGDRIRRLRTSSGVDLDHICSDTKISRRILDALETGKFQYLPERVFTRNFVRQYARSIGIDEEPLVEAFDAAWDRYQLTAGTHPDLVVVEAPPKGPIRWRFWFPIATGAMILVTVALVIISGLPPGEELMPDPRRPVIVQSRAVSAPASAPMIPSTVPVQQQTPQEPDLISLTVRVQEEKECWIQYRDREGMTGEHLLRGGEEVRLELRGPVKFTVGNAGAVSIVVDEVEYRRLGEAGQVIHTEVSHDGLVPLGIGSDYD